MPKKKLGFFDDEHFSTRQNEFIGEYNIENNSNTIEPGLAEINVDECDDEQLDVQACLWSDYKHHCTIKILVCITISHGL